MNTLRKRQHRVNPRIALEGQMEFWAHSAETCDGSPDSRAGWQPLAQHLKSVSGMARQFASAARPGDESFASEAGMCGLLHDYGKYTDCFQRRITMGEGRCPHAVHGAQLAVWPEGGKPIRPHLLSAAFAIAGHHSGLADLSGGSGSLQNTMRLSDRWAETVAILDRASRDCPAVAAQLDAWRTDGNRASLSEMKDARNDLRTRMLFSCLVDADRLDSAGRAPSLEPLMAEARLASLLDYVGELQSKAPPGIVRELRNRVLRDCLNAARLQDALFSLAVPTGGGKTLSSMAFALNRAALQPENYRRILVVIPYLSIIEQNAEIYARVFGRNAVLEHHSGAFEPLRPHDKDHWEMAPADSEEFRYQGRGSRPETENWDSPLIVTTAVRFFESLFSNRPSDLRRVHNIARSIVILDEVQTLPRRLLIPLLSMMKDLAENWGCTFVFSTATLPAFESSAGARIGLLEPGTIREIIQQPQELLRSLRRATIHWKLDEPWAWEHVANRMVATEQALCIVNVREHAAELYSIVCRMDAEKGYNHDAVYHLSTRMSAAHRLRRIGEIKAKLERKEPCRVVSTQLIEAGVDLDFPLVLRAIGPLESIIQAAGRADREGKLTAALGRPGGEVIVFQPADNRMPPNQYREAAALAASISREALERGASVQVDSADKLREYYERYYVVGQNAKILGQDLEAMRSPKDLKFATLADEFEMISSRTVDVFVPDDDEGREAIELLRVTGELTWELRRRLQRHVVGLLPYELQRARGVLEELHPGSGIWIAADQAYNKETGLELELEPGAYVL